MKQSKNIKKYNQFLNERYNVDTLPSDNILLSKIDEENIIFLLYNISKKIPIAYIGFCFYPEIESYTVVGVYSKGGYGVFLYECAMTYVNPVGLSMSRDSETSNDALKIWFKFKERPDVKHERMYSDEITHKKEDWLDSGYLNDRPEHRQEIFNLEDTRFYYNFGKDKLNKLLRVGKEYMIKNGITEQDVEYLSWKLE